MKAGDKYPTENGEHIEVLAVAKGYVMARRKGCAPFCVSAKEFDKKFKSSNRGS